MTQFHAGVPMERVHMDFLGPLPVTKNNNTYFLMMVDQFTKWVECIPLPTKSAEVTARLMQPLMNSSQSLVTLCRFLQIRGPILLFSCLEISAKRWKSIKLGLLLRDLQQMAKWSGLTELSWMLSVVLFRKHQETGMYIFLR